MKGFVLARLVAAGLLLWALDSHSYSYYVLLRWIVCGVAAYGVYLSVRMSRTGWAWVLGILALVFNPIRPVHLDRTTWAAVDIGSAALLISSIFLLRRRT
jgi:hypothetical protein